MDMTRARVNKRIRRLPGFGGWARREWRAGCKDEKDGEGGSGGGAGGGVSGGGGRGKGKSMGRAWGSRKRGLCPSSPLIHATRLSYLHSNVTRADFFAPTLPPFSHARVRLFFISHSISIDLCTGSPT